MEKHQEGKVMLKVFGMLLVLVSIIYLIMGILATAGEMKGLLPADKTAGILVIILAYGTALLAFVTGIVSMHTAKKGTGAGLCKILGIIVALFGIASLIYLQIAKHSFSVYDMVAAIIGIGIFIGASQAEKA